MSTPQNSTHPAWAQFLGGAPILHDTTPDPAPESCHQAGPAPGYAAVSPIDPENPKTWDQPGLSWDPAGYAAKEADAHCRSADDYSSQSDDALCPTMDSENELVSVLSAVTLALNANAQASLGVAYETRALRYELINSGGFEAVAGAISCLQDAQADTARQVADVAATVNDAGGNISHEIERLRHALTGTDEQIEINGALGSQASVRIANWPGAAA